MLSRRKFLGAAAATSATAFASTRSFSRSIERPTNKDISWESALFNPEALSCHIIFHLYNNGIEVHKQTALLDIEKRKNATHIGVNQSVLIHDFHGPADRCTLELPGTEHEVELKLYDPIDKVGISNAITLVGSDKGFLRLT